MFKKLLVVLFVSFLAVGAQAQQTKEEIQRKQQELQKELADLNRTLSEIKKSKKQSIGQLELVRRKINAREELVRNLNRDLRLIEDNIYLTNLEINRLKRELDTLKQNYAKSLVFAYKNRSNYDYLNFLFSATNFNDAMKRMAYLKSYRQYRETQVSNIQKTQSLLEQKAQVLNTNKAQKNSNLQEQNQQLRILETDKKEKDQVVKQLKGQEASLAKEIKTKEANRRKLQQSLQAIIRREIDEAKRKERERLAKLAEDEKRRKAAEDAAPKTSTGTPRTNTDVARNNPAPRTDTRRAERTYSALESTPEGLSSSLNFESNRGKLPWPVDAGFVSGPFGTHTVPGTRLKESNDGIVIETPVGSSVKAVASGVVSSIFDLGEYQAVLVKHGKYFTVYSRLSSVSVSRNQEVNAGTVVGRVAANFQGDGELEFQVMNEKMQYLNPESWLRRR